MIRKYFWIIIMLFAIGLISFSLNHNESNKHTELLQSKKASEHKNNTRLLSFPGYPEVRKGNQFAIFHHNGFVLAYCEKYEEAAWVAYVLTASKVSTHLTGRGNKFKPDPIVTTGSAVPADYANSGYDKGHLAPAADMKWSVESENQCFYMSNMTPQAPSFNRGIWNKLEGAVRLWAQQNDSVFVVTGPAFQGINTFIGPNKVGVPKYFFKAVLDISPPSIKAIGFVMKNEGSEAPIQQYAVTIDSIEKLTGLDLYPDLPDSIENAVEATIYLSQWF
jgi:endonuclease G, mitochondrial